MMQGLETVEGQTWTKFHAFDNPVLLQRGVVFKCADSDVKNTAFDTVLPEGLSTSGHPSHQFDVYGATDAPQGVCHQEIAQGTSVPDEFILDLDYDADSVDCDLMPAPPAPTTRVPDVTCRVPSDTKDDDCQSVSSEDSGFHSITGSSAPEREELDEDIWFVVDSCGDTCDVSWSSRSYWKPASRRHRYESGPTSRRHDPYDGNYGNSRRRYDHTKDFKRRRSYDNHYYHYSDRSSKRRRYY